MVARMLLTSPPTRSLHTSLERLVKAAQVGPSEANVDTRRSDTLYSPGTEDQSVGLDPRVVKTCKEFLEKVRSCLNHQFPRIGLNEITNSHIFSCKEVKLI